MRRLCQCRLMLINAMTKDLIQIASWRDLLGIDAHAEDDWDLLNIAPSEEFYGSPFFVTTSRLYRKTYCSHDLYNPMNASGVLSPVFRVWNKIGAHGVMLIGQIQMQVSVKNLEAEMVLLRKVYTKVDTAAAASTAVVTYLAGELPHIWKEDDDDLAALKTYRDVDWNFLHPAITDFLHLLSLSDTAWRRTKSFV